MSPKAFPVLAALHMATAAWAADGGDSHRAPAPSLARQEAGVSAERQNTLAEMWQRRILSPEAKVWSPEDMALLARMRSAEAAGALGFLKARLHSLRGLVVTSKRAGGVPGPVRLTKDGYERYLLARSQEALKYFGEKGVDAKWAFSLSDMKGRPLFDADGLLTEEGEDLYNRVLGGLAAFWKTPTGEVFGNRRPPRPAVSAPIGPKGTPKKKVEETPQDSQAPPAEDE